MNRGVAILAVCALFLSGVAIGALGMFLFAQRAIESIVEPPAPVGRFLSGHLARELDLSEGQQVEIREILRTSWRHGEELRRRMRPEVEELMQSTREAIEDVLTPEQREKFEQMRRINRGPIERLFLGPANGLNGRPSGPPGGPGGGPPDGRRGRRRPPQP